LTTRLLAMLAPLLASLSLLLAKQAALDLPERVDAGGRLVRMRVAGEGSPVVVCEIGLRGPLEEWAAVQPEVARFTRTVAYDRLGSDRGPGMLTGGQIARELHAALTQAHIQPPYVLVGQSFAGIYNRIFAATYPKEVAGIVLLDPAQERFIEWMEVHHPEHGLASIPREHWPEAAGIEATLDELKALGPLPDVPIIVVTGARRGHDRLRDTLLPVWTDMHEEWTRKLPQGRHVLAEKSGHAIHVDEPELVVGLIQEVVEQARKRHDGRRVAYPIMPERSWTARSFCPAMARASIR
jgi:pimeloyl-ACP methyl ester carboxylesterase